MKDYGYIRNTAQDVAYFEYTHHNYKCKRRIAIAFGTVEEAHRFLHERHLLWTDFFNKHKYSEAPETGLYNDFYFENVCKGRPSILGEVVIDGFGHGCEPDHYYDKREIEYIRKDYAKAVKDDPIEKKMLEEIHPKCILIKAVSENDLKI